MFCKVFLRQVSACSVTVITVIELYYVNADSHVCRHQLSLLLVKHKMIKATTYFFNQLFMMSN